DLPRHIAQLPEPEAPQEMRRRLGNNLDGLKWVALGLLAFLRNHHRNASFQRGDLPIDMQHLRFQKRRAITGDSRPRLGSRVQCRRLDVQRSTSNAERSRPSDAGSEGLFRREWRLRARTPSPYSLHLPRGEAKSASLG